VFKVGVWGPGSMGVIALRGVIDHPQLELVDVVVHSDAKAGRDAGELCGIAPVGWMPPRTQRPCWPAMPTWWSMPPAPTCGR
jgi:hypothetical protein